MVAFIIAPCKILSIADKDLNDKGLSFLKVLIVPYIPTKIPIRIIYLSNSLCCGTSSKSQGRIRLSLLLLQLFFLTKILGNAGTAD